jgi:CheY-like chemotaxis protein
MTRATPPRPSKSDAEGPKTTVLLVDDDRSVLALYGALLQKAGYAVLQARDSAEALDLCQLQAGPIHLIIADVMLPPQALQLAKAKKKWPQMHGPQLVGRIKKTRPEIKVIFMSAHPEERLRSHGVNPETMVVLTKPLSPDALLRQVRQMLN